MPNWVYNELTLVGPKADIQRFIERAKSFRVYKWGVGELKTDADIVIDQLAPDSGEDVCRHEGPLNFDAFVPVPEDIIKAGYSDVGYKWQIRNWGCKWNASDCAQGITPRGAYYSFQTPWSIPIPAIAAMSEQFPTIRFRIKSNEESEGDWGSTTFKNGEVIKIIDQP
jgi:hypothetical protein